MKRSDFTSRIKPPTYKIGRFVFNEYETREIIARIAEGTLNHEDVIITDEKGNVITFDETGLASGQLHGWDLNSNCTMRRWKVARKKRNK